MIVYTTLYLPIIYILYMHIIISICYYNLINNLPIINYLYYIILIHTYIVHCIYYLGTQIFLIIIVSLT